MILDMMTVKIKRIMMVKATTRIRIPDLPREIVDFLLSLSDLSSKDADGGVHFSTFR